MATTLCSACQNSTDKKSLSTSERFELPRVEPNRFLVYLLNHSDKTSLDDWRLGGSIPWPPACKAGALPAELSPQNQCASCEDRTHASIRRAELESAALTTRPNSLHMLIRLQRLTNNTHTSCSTYTLIHCFRHAMCAGVILSFQ